MKRAIIAKLTVLITALLMTGTASAVSHISIATGGTAETYYPIGSAIANALIGAAIADAVSEPGTLQCTVKTGNGSIANAKLISNKTIELAMIQSDISHWAYNGEFMFEGKPIENIRAITALFSEHIHIVFAKNAKVQTFPDLKEKRVGIASPGSGAECTIRAIFQTAGLTYNDLKKVNYLDFAATANALRDDHVDAGFLISTYPSATVEDLAARRNISLLNFDEDLLVKLNDQYPFLVRSVIPAKTYNGIDEDTTTVSVKTTLVAHADVSEEDVYNFTKNFFQNIDSIHAAHAKATEITLENALDGLTAPLHPGAERFYREMGIIQ